MIFGSLVMLPYAATRMIYAIRYMTAVLLLYPYTEISMRSPIRIHNYIVFAFSDFSLFLSSFFSIFPRDCNYVRRGPHDRDDHRLPPRFSAGIRPTKPVLLCQRLLLLLRRD